MHFCIIMIIKQHNLRTTQGFTLLEILVALAIFAILALITSQALKVAFRTKEILFKQTSELSQLELGFALLIADVNQITARPVLGNEMHLFPAFIGQPDYVEFTRSDQAIVTIKQPPFVRIAYLCKQNKLIRRRFNQLDSQDRKQFLDQTLFEGLSVCRFSYLNATLDVLPLWRSGAIKQNQQIEPLPKAIQVTIEHSTFGNMANLFIIPEALYAHNETQG